jgi:hypothetical protein
MSAPKCPTGKRTYLSKYAAKIALRRQQTEPDAPAVRMVYRCTSCDAWHLTSKPPLRRDAPPERSLGESGSTIAGAYNTLRASGASHADAIDQLLVSFDLDRGTLRRVLKRAGVLDDRSVEAPSPVSRRAELATRRIPRTEVKK